MLVKGRVTASRGTPIAGALLDVWQANEDGFYDVQQKGIQPDMNLRGIFTHRRRRPLLLPLGQAQILPHSGRRPGRQDAAALGRHRFRPAHVHFIVGAAGFHPITTHYFAPDDPYLESDAVFGVKESLIA